MTIKDLRRGDLIVDGAEFNQFCSRLVRRGYLSDVSAGQPGYRVILVKGNRKIFATWDHKAKNFQVTLKEIKK